MTRNLGRLAAIIIMTAFCITATFASSQEARCKALLQEAVRSPDVPRMRKFLQCVKDMSAEKQHKFKVNEENFEAVRQLHLQLLTRKWDDTLLVMHIEFMRYFQVSAEGSEGAAEDFSNQFIKDLPLALQALDRVHNRKRLQAIVQSVAFVEGNADKVVEYLRQHALTEKPYYKAFLDQSTSSRKEKK